jgi:hypothetical protein
MTNKSLAAVLCLGIAGSMTACKSEEQKQVEAAREQLALAQERAAQAQAQLAKAELAQAEKQMAQGAAKLEKEGEAIAAQGAALGMKAAAAGMEAATAAMNSVAASLGQGGGKAALVDFRALKALLPESVGGLKRVSATGEKGAAMGMGASHAEGKYEGGDNARMTIKVVDTAGLGGVAMAALGLATVEVDKETETGYERTTVIGGNKALEKYDNKSRRGEVNILVANRFVVEVDGSGVSMEEMKEAAGKIDLAKLQALGAAATAAAK